MVTLNQLEQAVSIAAYVAKFGQPLTVPPNYSGDASAKTELIPIWLKNSLNRDSFPGHATIEDGMHTMKKAGDALEKDIGEAIAWIQAEEKKIIQDITNWIHHQINAMTAGGTQPSRAAKAIAAVILFVKQVLQLIHDLQQIITALMDIIRYLISIIQRIQAYLQGILNAIATLINQICNFHLPALPSIPNLFGGLHFDGFKFTKGMFKFQLTFNTQFAFGNCQIRNLGLNPFSTILQNFQNAAPLTVNPSGYIGSPMTDSYTSAYFVPPLNGTVLPAPPPPFTPVFNPSFNPLTDFSGALPAPSAIVNTFELPPAELQPQVLSLVGGPILDENPPGVIPGTISIYPASSVPYGQYIAQVRAFCQAKVNLSSIEAASTSGSGSSAIPWDPTLFNPGGDQTGSPVWALCWAWITFMNQCRGVIPVVPGSPNVAATPTAVPGAPATLGQISGRGGTVWIPAFQAVFAAFVDAASATNASSAGPCYHDINDPIPWNAGPAAVAAATAWSADPSAPLPSALTPVAGAQSSGPAQVSAFFHAIASLAPATRGQVLWMLSYLEASLLGYPRTTTWDTYAPGGPAAPATPHPLALAFGNGPTGLDLDYQQIPAPTSQATTDIVLNSGGLANYPSTISVPNYLLPVMNTVIGLAEASILNSNTYASSNLRSMYVYTAQATAVLINSYSQFWRDFASNWTALQAQPAALQAMVYNYPLILASALNPRSGCGSTNQGQGVTLNPADPYTLLVADFKGRTGNGSASGFLYHYLDPNTAVLTSPATRWSPGWPWPIVANIPQVFLPATNETVPQAGAYGSPVFVTGTPDGWDREPDPNHPGETILSGFNPAVFYQRPDIMALPYTEQQALCGLNQAFDDVVNTGAQLLQDNQASINSCYASITDAQAQIANIESMSTTPLLDSLNNPYYMDANGTPLLTATGTASVPPFTDFYSAATPPYVPVAPFTTVPFLSPPADASGALTTNLPVADGGPGPYPAIPQSSTDPGLIDFTSANQPVDSMYTDPAALPTLPTDLPPLPNPGVIYASPTPVAATPSLLLFRQQILATVPPPITITSQPEDTSAAIGSTASFTVASTVPTPLTPMNYQWQVQVVTDGVASFVNLTDPSATSATYVTPPVTADMDQNVYQCVVSSTFGAPTPSDPALLTVTS